MLGLRDFPKKGLDAYFFSRINEKNIGLLLDIFYALELACIVVHGLHFSVHSNTGSRLLLVHD